MEDVGPAVPISASILNAFRLFFTAALMSTVIEQTNLYARQVLGDNGISSWTDVTESEILAFLGFAILMGINQLPSLLIIGRKTLNFTTLLSRIESAEIGSFKSGNIYILWTILHYLSDPIQNTIGFVGFVQSLISYWRHASDHTGTNQLMRPDCFQREEFHICPRSLPRKGSRCG